MTQPARSLRVVVEESLATVLTKRRVKEVLERARQMAGHDEVPERPAALRVFVEGALFLALLEYLDTPRAVEALAQLGDALGHTEDGGIQQSSFVRRKRREVPTEPEGLTGDPAIERARADVLAVARRLERTHPEAAGQLAQAARKLR